MTNSSIARLFKMTPQGIGKWKKEKRPIITFIEKYFTDKDIEEFLNIGKIERFEIIQNNNYLINKSIKLYNAINLSLEFKAKKIFFLELTKLHFYKIEDVSNIIFYLIKDEDLDLSTFDTDDISEMSVRLNLFKIFQKIDSFEIEYFIRNLKKIRKESFLRSCGSKAGKTYLYDIENIEIFGEKFFNIEKDSFLMIKNWEEYNGKISLFLDILNHDRNKNIEVNKKLDLAENEMDIFLDLINF